MKAGRLTPVGEVFRQPENHDETSGTITAEKKSSKDASSSTEICSSSNDRKRRDHQKAIDKRNDNYHRGVSTDLRSTYGFYCHHSSHPHPNAHCHLPFKLQTFQPHTSKPRSYEYPFHQGKSFEDGYGQSLKKCNSQGYKSTPQTHQSEGVNIISPHHRSEPVDNLETLKDSTHRSTTFQYPHYNPSTPVISSIYRQVKSDQRRESIWSASKSMRQCTPNRKQPHRFDYESCSLSTRSDNHPPVVAESSFDSDHHPPSSFTTHSTTPTAPTFPGSPLPSPQENNPWGCFDITPVNLNEYRLFAGESDTPNSSYARGAVFRQLSPGNDSDYSPDENWDLTKYHPVDSGNESQENVWRGIIEVDGCMVPRAALEINFKITCPPVAPITPPSDIPLRDCSANINSHDVLCGRGGGTNSQIGNRRYRQLVQDFQPTYLLARRKEKPLLARTIVLIIRNRGGRFLRKDEDTGELFEVGDVKAEAKTSQALREGLDVRASKSTVNRHFKKKKRGKESQDKGNQKELIPAVPQDLSNVSSPKQSSINHESPIEDSTLTPSPSQITDVSGVSKVPSPSPPVLPKLQNVKLEPERTIPSGDLLLRKRRRMNSGIFISSDDKLFSDFCPPRAHLVRNSEYLTTDIKVTKVNSMESSDEGKKEEIVEGKDCPRNQDGINAIKIEENKKEATKNM
jgi:hypothetical protein